jgi:hypothetical protein
MDFWEEWIGLTISIINNSNNPPFGKNQGSFKRFSEQESFSQKS